VPIGSGEPGRVKSAATAAKLPRRRVRFLQARESREVEVYRFEAIPADARIAGPAIVESSFTSIVIDPGATAPADAAGDAGDRCVNLRHRRGNAPPPWWGRAVSLNERSEFGETG